MVIELFFLLDFTSHTTRHKEISFSTYVYVLLYSVSIDCSIAQPWTGNPAQPTTQQQPAPCLDDQQQSQRVSRPALIVIADTDRQTVHPEPEDPLKLNCPFQCCELTSVAPIRLKVDQSLTEHVAQNSKRKRNFNDESWLLAFKWLQL